MGNQNGIRLLKTVLDTKEKKKEGLQTPKGPFYYQRRILYPAKLSVKYNGRIKTWSDTQSLHRFASSVSFQELCLLEKIKGDSIKRKRELVDDLVIH